MESTIFREIRGSTLHIFTDSERKHPFLNETSLNVLMDAVNTALESRDISAVITYGKKESFCTGLDINGFNNLPPKKVIDIIKVGINAANKIEQSNKPFIAAISGYCLGGGLEIILPYDYIIASPDAKFGLPEVKIGVIPGADGIKRLVRCIGKRRALDLVLTGRTVDAREALAIGLINEVVSKKKLLSRAQEVSEELSSRNPPAISAIKRLSNIAAEKDISKEELQEFENCLKTDFAKTAINAFLNKR